jgi:hypothetical protein
MGNSINDKMFAPGPSQVGFTKARHFKSTPEDVAKAKTRRDIEEWKENRATT